MRVGISNIAWDPHEDDAVATLLSERGIDSVDVAPGKYFPDPTLASETQIDQVRNWWKRRGFELTGMQALLFGTTGFNLFGADEVQQAMLRHLAAVCRIGSRLGARKLVFGSPRNRDRQGLTDERTTDVAVDFFQRLGEVAASYEVVICLEPNPPRYGSNFMTTSEETARIVALTGHPAIKMQLDVGAMHINNENPALVLQQFAHHVGHVHASEPDLVPLGDGGVAHETVHRILARSLPDHIVTIEMVATKTEPHIQSIGRALTTAAKSYQSAETGTNS